MKRWLRRMGAIGMAGVLCVLSFWIGTRLNTARCELRRSPHDGQTIEVWRSGVLTDEWQPDDGAIYAMLDCVLREEIPAEAIRRARERLNRQESKESK